MSLVSSILGADGLPGLGNKRRVDPVKSVGKSIAGASDRQWMTLRDSGLATVVAHFQKLLGIWSGPGAACSFKLSKVCSRADRQAVSPRSTSGKVLS